jgi:hypothetical protein
MEEDKRSFHELVTEFHEATLAEIGVSLPDIPHEMVGEMALYFAHECDLQVRLARTFARRDLPADMRMVQLVLKGAKDRMVKFWFEDGDDMLHAEPVPNDLDKPDRSSLLLKREHSFGPGHFSSIARDGVRMLIDSFGATYGSPVEVVAPLAPEFDETAVMTLLYSRVRSDPEDGYTLGEECDPDFTALYDAIQSVLQPLATESPYPGGDYFLVGYDNGSRQQKIEIEEYSLLHPDIIHALRGLLQRFPSWEIVIGVGASPWPPMGLTLRTHEIIDGL